MSSWFVRRPRPSARARLFCFPFSGGGPSAFRGWAEAFPELEVCAVQAPGRETRLREAPFTRMEPLVTAAVDAMRPLLDRPFAFYGHSLGAFVGFEVARAFRREGLPLPRRLFAGACPAPGLHRRDEPLHTQPDARLVEAVRRYGGTPDEVLRHPELMALLLPVIRADFAVYETYAPAVEPLLAVPITSMAGLTDPAVPRERVEGWAAHTGEGHAHRLFPGGHFFLQTDKPAVLDAVRADLVELLAE